VKRPTIISVTNHKGGVGKTSLSVNLSQYFLKYVDKVLVIDMDPQAHATWWLCKYADSVSATISDVLKFGLFNDIEDLEMRKQFKELVVKATYDRFMDSNKQISVITSNLGLADTKVELSSSMQESIKYFRIREAIRFIAKDYDIVIIDTPPSIELLTWAAIASSDYILLPVQLDALSISGAKDVMNKIVPAIRKYYNPDIRILGMVINLHHDTKVSRISEEIIRETFKDYLFRTFISRSVRVGELATIGETLNKVSPKSKSAKEFESLTKEILERLDKKGGKDR
jgi:chromosome partitioning protein